MLDILAYLALLELDKPVDATVNNNVEADASNNVDAIASDHIDAIASDHINADASNNVSVNATIGDNDSVASDIEAANVAAGMAFYETVELMFAAHHTFALNYAKMSEIAQASGKSISATALKERLREIRVQGRKMRREFDNTLEGSEALQPLRKRGRHSMEDDGDAEAKRPKLNQAETPMPSPSSRMSPPGSGFLSLGDYKSWSPLS